MHLLWHVLYVDLWGPVWPNLTASVIWATPAFAVHHRLMKRHLDRRLEEHHERLRGDG